MLIMPPIAAQQSVVRKMGCECRRTTRGNPGKTCDECERRECKFSSNKRQTNQNCFKKVNILKDFCAWFF